MRDYEELVKSLRICADSADPISECCFSDCCKHDEPIDPLCMGQLIHLAADAIKELSKPKWIMIESRPMDEEERRYYSEQYSYNLTGNEAVIYCCQLPEHGQEVLVCNKYGHIWLDTFDDDPDYGVGFETNGNMDGIVAWMPLPEPPEEGTNDPRT